MDKPLLITPGDPSGIGPEITLRALASDSSNIVVMAERTHLEQLAEKLELSICFQDVCESALDTQTNGCVKLLPIHWAERPKLGKPSAKNAAAIIKSIEYAASLAKAGKVSGIVTNPISKAVLYEAGFSHPGHTEFLGQLDGVSHPVMMLANEMLRVVPLTIHIPLNDVAVSIDDALFCNTVRIVETDLRDKFGISSPKIAIAGLNPHAGEAGHIGRDEIDKFIPLIERLKAEGINASGPYPADSLFHPEARSTYDVVVAMYHDQALIPVKTLDFYGSVNITLGLSFIRTSPDHGTAFDRAKTLSARPDSICAAIRSAKQMAHYHAKTIG